MATRLKPSRINVDNTPQVGEGAAYKSDDDFHWSMGGGDMSYRDFEWNTLTGNSITIEDISNNITPSSDFTVSAGTELKPGIEYVLRVNTGNTPYTMTLGTGVTNPNGYSTTLEPNTINQFKFMATSASQLELEGVNIPETTNTKTFYLSSTSDLTNAQAAYDWYLAGKNPIIVFNNCSYVVTSSGNTSLTFSAPQLNAGGDAYESSYQDLIKGLMLAISSGTVTNIYTNVSQGPGSSRNFLAVNVNYSTPYNPQYPGSPATKKYVDDHDTVVSATAPSSPTEGMVWYDTTNDVLKVYNGSSWESIATGGAISDTAYGPGWDGQTTTAPSQNVVYDKIESVEGEISTNTSAISTINGKIPSEATTSNQLADKEYVLNNINSVTAYYITKNVQGDQFATYAELAAATTFYSGGVARVPTRNDYTIVLSDETHDNATTRYIYNNGWEYQYTVNETALTQAQLNAINSGITAAKVTQYDGYATSKQDVLTAGDNINISNNVISADVNTKTFDGAWNTTTAQSVYNWIKTTGHYAIVKGSTSNSLMGNVVFSPTTTTTGNVSSRPCVVVHSPATTGMLYERQTTMSMTVSSGTVTSVTTSSSDINTAGVVTQRGSSAPSSPVQGSMWYDTTNNVLKVYDGSNWSALGGGGIQLASNSEYDVAYHWYGRQSTFDGLSQYYTSNANDTAYFTIED